MMLSGLFLLAIIGAAYLCARRPAAGVLALVASVPFYALMRESSAGSPIYFVWPYVMVAVLIGTMTLREVTARLAARGVTSPHRRLLVWGAAAAVLALVALELDARVVSTMLTDASLGAVGPALASRSFQTLAIVGMLGLVGVMILFLKAMHTRDGHWSAMDLAIAAFLIYGLLQIISTYLRNGILFTGLNGFRYYFAGALAYVPARYFMVTERDRRWFTYAVVGVVSLGGMQMLLESYFLNVLGWPPDQLPWVGHLAGQFEYLPSPKAFFSGAFVPLGPLYFTHVSGLVVILGLCLALPLTMVAADRRKFAAGLVVVAFLVVAAHWTSRTGLLILAMTSAIAILATRISWSRRVIALLVIVAATVIGARHLIPGAVYDLRAEGDFLFGQAVPNLLRAIGDDVYEITGWRIGEATDRTGWRPIGWRLVGRGRFEREPQDNNGRYHLLFESGEQALEFRYAVPPFAVQPGDELTWEVQFEAVTTGEAGLQIFQGDKVSGIVKPFAPGQIAAWTTDFVVGPAGAVTLDIDIGANTQIKVRYARLHTPRGSLRLLGFGPGQWLPLDWTLNPGDAQVWPALQNAAPTAVQGALMLTGGSVPTRLTIPVPTEYATPGDALVATADVRALAPARVGLVVAQGPLSAEEFGELAAGDVRTFSVTIPALGADPVPTVTLDYPRASRLELLSVRVGKAATATVPLLGDRGGLPDAWGLTSAGRFEREALGETGRYRLDLISGDDQLSLHYRVPAFVARPGDRLVLEAELEALRPTSATVQISQGPAQSSGWQAIAAGEVVTRRTELVVDGDDAVTLDIGVPPNSRVSVRSVVLTAPHGRLYALGYEPPHWAPTGWTLEPFDAHLWPAAPHPVLNPDGAALVLTSGTTAATYRYELPGGQAHAGRPLIATAQVRALTAGDVKLRVDQGGQTVETVETLRLNEVRTLQAITPGVATTAPVHVALAVPAFGRIEILSVQTGASLERQTPLHAKGVFRRIVSGQVVDAPVPPPPPGAPGPPAWARGGRGTGPGAVAGRGGVIGTFEAPATPGPAVGATAPVRSSTPFELLFGVGAEFGTWNQVFFSEATEGQFAAATRSDTKYLEFGQQFGLVGLAILIVVHVIPLWVGWRRSRDAADATTRALALGLCLMVLVSAISLLHLPSLFLQGFGVPVYVAMALLMMTPSPQRS